VQFKTGKKPEKLLRRCLQLCTRPGDWVLDPFAGSGTTAAVAHKMGRAWIAMEAGGIHAASRERMERVVEGDDPHGISALEGWSGGGTFSCA
jgi:adenine-specific DNA-methyltransferase